MIPDSELQILGHTWTTVDTLNFNPQFRMDMCPQNSQSTSHTNCLCSFNKRVQS